MKLLKLCSIALIAAMAGSLALADCADARRGSYVRVMRMMTRKAPVRTPSHWGTAFSSMGGAAAGTVVGETVYDALKTDPYENQQDVISQCKEGKECRLDKEHK